jgi:hypothetical protein
VELLTGKPPFFDLAPMAALFRIVQVRGCPFSESSVHIISLTFFL